LPVKFQLHDIADGNDIFKTYLLLIGAMKTLFIPVKYKNLNIQKQINKLRIKEKYSIVTTIQFLKEIKNATQILGCNIEKVKPSQAYLYVGTGKFHPLNLAFETKKPVYTLNPITKEFSKISKEEINSFERRKKGALLKYLNAETIGIIVSTKPGQNRMEQALKFQKTCKKKSYLFLCNEVRGLEDFPQIDCWVNTACPRIFEDDFSRPMINLKDILKNSKNLCL
jgi:2-(3-amino-3-carboxypropyl)histidine synthase